MKQVDKIKNLENLSYFNKDTISQYIDIKPNSLSEVFMLHQFIMKEFRIKKVILNLLQIN